MPDSEEIDTHKPKKSKDSASGLSFKIGGNRFQLPLQGGTLLAVLALGWQSFVAFGDMQRDVSDMVENVDNMADVVDEMQDDLAETNRTVEENSKLGPQLGELRSQHREETGRLQNRIDTLEKCVRRPKKCDL